MPDALTAQLARRLRELRTTALPGLPLTQAQVARALGVSVPSVSSWESAKSPAVPPADRLRAYAMLFALGRASTNGRILLPDDTDLTVEDQHRRDELYRELLVLHPGRNQASTASAETRLGGPYRFGEGERVTIVCAALPGELLGRVPYSDPNDPDHVKLYTYADPDALVELFGHVRAANPTSRVSFRLASDLKGDDYTGHLIVLGGVDWNELTRELLTLVEVPVRQTPSDDPGGSCFEVAEADSYRSYHPTLRYDGVLIEDIAHVFRGPNPYNRTRTLTICNGTFGRGTYAAVRALTDDNFRHRNEEYIRERYAGRDTFSILSRVRIAGGEAVTPDWTVPQMRLHEWSG